MEASEIAERIHGDHEAHSADGDATFRKLTAIYVGVVAMLLAISSLGGSHATKTMLNANIQASDTYGFYQARNIRQTGYQLAAEQLDCGSPGAARHARGGKDQDRRRIKRYRERVDRYESDPSGGEGKKELLAKAKAVGSQTRPCLRAGPEFRISRRRCSRSRSCSARSASSPPRARWSMLSGVLAVAASLLMINGYFLLVHLPFE